MAQDDRSSYVEIDIKDAGPNCAVCMEPLEWVAVAPCGHREVCAGCTARIRCFENDRRCCICRSHCHTVFVTNANRSRPPHASGGDGQVDDYYWYHPGMGAYFDDLCQYEEMRKVCAKSPCSSADARGERANLNVGALSPPANINVNQLGAPAQQADAPPRPWSSVGMMFLVFVYIAVMLALIILLGVFFVAADERSQRGGILLALYFLVLVFALSAVFIWEKFNKTTHSGDG